MIDACSMLAAYVVNALWQIPFFAFMGWLICRLLRRLGPAVEHRVWVAILFASIVVPAGHALRPAHVVQVSSSVAGRTTLQTLPIDPERGYSFGVLSLAPATIKVAACCYLLVWLVFVLRFGASLLLSVRLLRRSRPLVLTAEYGSVLQEVRQSLHAPEIQVRVCPGLPGPVTLSIGGPVLLLPEGFQQSTAAEDFRAAVAHEAAHVVRHDFLKNLFFEGISCLIAFHPAAWWIKARLAQTREMTCDAVATRSMGGSRAYVQSLLRLASAVSACTAAPVSHAIGIFDANLLEKRIMTLRAKQTIVPTNVRYGLVLAGSLALLLAAAGGSAAAVELAARGAHEAPAAGQNGNVYTVGGEVSAPKVLSAPEVEYPESARKKEGAFTGTVLVGLVVDASGTPREVHVIHPLGDEFDQNALKEVQHYRFAPAMRAGVAVAVAMMIEIKFEKF